MTYVPRNPTKQPMGDIVQRIGEALSQVAGTVGTVGAIASDPFSSELVCRVKQVVALGTPQRVSCSSTPLRVRSPANLKKPVVAMRAYVYAEQRPWAYAATIATVVGVPFLLGYLTGRKP